MNSSVASSFVDSSSDDDVSSLEFITIGDIFSFLDLFLFSGY